MKQIFRDHFLIAVIVFLFTVGLATIPLIGVFLNIKLANKSHQEQLEVYQNLKIEENHFLGSSQKVTCDGNLFYQSNVPVTAIHIDQGSLYLSQINDKMVIFDLLALRQLQEFKSPVLTDLHSNTSGVYGTDLFNDQVVKIVSGPDGFTAQKYYPKIGRASAITMDDEGYFYASGYSSGNITKIIGRDGFIFRSGLDNIIDLEASGTGHLLVARYNAKPTLVAIDLNKNEQTIIEFEKNISSLVFDGEFFWVAYNLNGESHIGKIIGEKIVDNQTINCPFPLKIAVLSDRFFYTSLEDNEGKVYWTNKNLPKNGR